MLGRRHNVLHSPALMANAQPPPGETFGDYWLERRVARGGTSEVYLAHEGGAGGRVLVIKRLLPELRLDPESIGLFAREAELHRLVHHPNVVQVYGAGQVDGEPFLAMEFVDGVDAFQLLRRAQADEQRPPPGLAIHIGMALCEALDALHNAHDAGGYPLGILHRDVTPSNVYLSADGAVFLGDFGIARTTVPRGSRPQIQGAALRGKQSYLAPEQISGEAADQRADLFSCAVVVSELVLGRPLFVGAGQVAVLLAIRDGRIDALRAAARWMPLGLFDVLNRALARDPAARYPTARALGQALSSFAPPPEEGRQLVAEWVARTRDARSLARRIGGALIESDDRLRQQTVPPSGPNGVATPRRGSPDDITAASWDEVEPITARIDEVPSRVRFTDGRELNGVRFARLIEMTVTGELSPDDQIDLMEQGWRRVADVELLERHLPGSSTTRNVAKPTPPDETADLSRAELLPLLGRLAREHATGLLMLEGRADGDEGNGRREVYLQGGNLLHVASGEPTDLLGQNLVRRGVLSSEELDMALAVLPRFHGRLGDTLIALGLVDAVLLFQAISEQGKGRFLRVFSWTEGQAQFFRGAQPTRVDFPLAIDLASLLLEGMEIAYPNDTPIIQSRSVLGHRLRLLPGLTAEAVDSFPPALRLMLRTVGATGIELRHLLARLATSPTPIPPPSSLRAMYVGIAMGLCEIA